MSDILVVGESLRFGGRQVRCAIGKGGFTADKKEGDGCTPVGTFPLRSCWYREDRGAMPKTGLACRAIRYNDGWCDDPKSPDYNQPVVLPYGYSHELMWRTDHVYDLVVPIGYNDAPVVPGRGSAIFIHLAREGYVPTEGCIALAREDMLKLLAQLGAHSTITLAER